MKLLVTNDDGIEAEGLAALAEASRAIGDPVIVAPVAPQSGVSHRVTWHEGVRIEPRREKRHSAHRLAAESSDRFAIHGTPADCTRLGLLHLVPDAKWVLSGINHGANLGADVYYSGTVAAVREAVLHGWPGIAVSHYFKPKLAFDWQRATRWIIPILQDLTSRAAPAGFFYNINLPHLTPDDPDPDVIECPLDPEPLPLNYRHEKESGLYYAGDYRLRPRTPGADVDVCFGGRIAITAVKLL